MIDDHRKRILSAAALVYAQHGWRGATTRRIAEEAGVNEVTIFRQFGSKDTLLDAAMRECAEMGLARPLSGDPADPQAELEDWVRDHHAALSSRRDFVRQMLSEAPERPESASCAAAGPSGAFAQLQQYVVQLRRQGWLDTDHKVQPAEARCAVTMLMAAVFADAMNREIMPLMFPQPVEDSLCAYVAIFLRGIGVQLQPNPALVRTIDHADSSPQSSTE